MTPDCTYPHNDMTLQACMAGIVFAKFTKPTMRAETILFSKNALVTLRQAHSFIIRLELENYIFPGMAHSIWYAG